MSDIVDFRRKLLGFESPIQQNYLQHHIPRYYSNFYPSNNWFEMLFSWPTSNSDLKTEHLYVTQVMPPAFKFYKAKDQIPTSSGFLDLLYVLVILAILYKLVC